jgi:hypothetical protein
MSNFGWWMPTPFRPYALSAKWLSAATSHNAHLPW